MIVNEIHNPFPGLRAFEENEDYLFFGRERQIDDLLKKLRTTHFIAVIGVSGSGKSSLVKCGLLPALHSGYMAKAGSSWKVVVFRPGDDPIGNMAKSLARPGLIYENEDLEATYTSIIETTLRRSNLGLIETVKQSELGQSDNLLIVVDQFEELFRFSKYEKNKYTERRDSISFVDLLLNACSQEEIPIYVVLTMRSDFIGDCTGFSGLPEAINHSQYLVPRMSREERKEAISGPVAVGGAKITQRLLTNLLNDVGDNPDQLPILQHALLRTWRYWDQTHKEDEPLDIQHYQAIGTMTQALSQHAEEAYQELKSERSKKICESLFKSITEKGEERQGTRKPTKLGEICLIANASLEEVKEVIDVFRKDERSFLMPPMEVPLNEDSIIDISHESLMRIWERLIKWVDEETQCADVYKRLAEAAALYQEARSGLLRNPELQFALKWYEENKPNRAWAYRYDPSFERAIGFLKESKRQEEFELLQKEKQEKLKIRRIRFFAMVLGSAAIVAILMLIIVMNLQIKAQQNADLAEERAKEARLQKNIAEAEKKEANQQSKEAERQKREAEIQKQIAEAQRKTAEEQKVLALNNFNDANFQKKVALEAMSEAEIQKKEALDQKQKAELLQGKAENSEKRINKLRILALSRTLAFQSQREYRNNNNELSALLARQAYKLNIENGGQKLNPDIYNSLAQVADDRLIFADHTDAVRCVRISGNGEKVISASDDKTIRIWYINPDKNPQILRSTNSNLRSLACAANSEIIAAGDVDGNIIIWDLLSKKENKSTIIKIHNGGVNSLVFDKSSKRIVSGGADGAIYLLNLDRLSDPPFLLDKIPFKITCLALAPDGVSLAVASEEPTIRIYNIKQVKTPPLTLTFRDRKTKSIAFSPDGKYLAAGGYNGLLEIWKVSDEMKLLFALSGHNSSINSLEFSPDNELVASASSDGTVKLWDYKNPEPEPIILRGHSTWVWSIAFNPKGNTLISGSQDRTMRSWTADIDALAQKICSKVTRNLTLQEWHNYIGENVNYEKTCNNF